LNIYLQLNADRNPLEEMQESTEKGAFKFSGASGTTQEVDDDDDFEEAIESPFSLEMQQV